MADNNSTEMRRCIGSARYGIEAHDAPVADFPLQPSQKDGLGRMCKVHWNAYTRSLARDAKARKAVTEGGDPQAGATPEPVANKRRSRAKVATPEPGAQGDAA